MISFSNKPASNSIKIGLDAVPLNQPCGGIGHFIFYLLDALILQHPNWTFFLYTTSTKGEATYFKKYPNAIIRPLPVLKGSHTIWSQTILPLGLSKDKIDVFWGTTQSIPLIGPKKMKTIMLLHDFVFHFFPETVATLKCFFLQCFTRAMVHKADSIICNSQGTADKFFDLYAKRPNHIISPPLKSSIEYQSKKCAEPFLSSYALEYKKYFFTLGTLEPRKNFIGLLHCYLQLLKDHPDLLPLVIAGGGGWKNKAIKYQLEAAAEKFPRHIQLLGHVSDKMLSHLLSGARYYLCFSMYEGYGMPLAEARHCRTPVICFDQPEMREAAENDGVFLPQADFEPILKKHLLMQDPLVPSICQYMSTEEKARMFSHAILDLLDL